MLQHTEQLESGQNALVSAETVASDQQTQVTPPSEPATRSDEAPADPLQGNSQRHAEAGRKGAYRIHELVRLGRLYEQEHGLSPRRKRRTPRLKPQQVLKGLLQTLWHVARPKYRPDLRRLLEVLDSGQA